jgi:hypothetical protein
VGHEVLRFAQHDNVEHDNLEEVLRCAPHDNVEGVNFFSRQVNFVVTCG